MRIQTSVTIRRPREEVFSYMSNAENDRYWRTNVKSIERVGDGETSHVGAEYRQKLTGPFGGFTADLRYTEFVPNERVAFETIRGSVRPSATISFSDAGDDATAVDFDMVWEPRGPSVLLLPIVGPILRKTVTASYQNLVRHLEAREDERQPS